MAKLKFSYDEPNDVIIIEGTKYAGDFFRSFSSLPMGSWLKIESRDGDTVTLMTNPEMEKTMRDLSVTLGRSIRTLKEMLGENG